MKSNLEEIKAERRKELLAILEIKKKSLQKHLEYSVNKSIEAGKGLIAIGSGVLLLYTIFDRFLESRFRTHITSPTKPTSKSASNKLLLPIFSMLLQQGTSLLFDASQKRLVDYLKNKKATNERISGGVLNKK